MFWNKPKKPTVEKLTPLDKIKDYCKQELITLNQLEKRCGIPENTIIKWNKEKPNPKYLARIALIMNVSPFWLESGKHYRKPSPLEEVYLYVLHHTNQEGFDIIFDAIWKAENKIMTNEDGIVNLEEYKKRRTK